MEDVKVYMVVNLDIKDKDTYLKYEKGFFPMLKKGDELTFIFGDSGSSSSTLVSDKKFEFFSYLKFN